VSNHPKRLCPKGMVVSVGGKVQEIPAPVSVREMSESKPTDDSSIIQNVVKTRGTRYRWEKSAGYLITGQAATGVKVA
jgi:hypothetical protein